MPHNYLLSPNQYWQQILLFATDVIKVHHTYVYSAYIWNIVFGYFELCTFADNNFIFNNVGMLKLLSHITYIWKSQMKDLVYSLQTFSIACPDIKLFVKLLSKILFYLICNLHLTSLCAKDNVHNHFKLNYFNYVF